MHTNRAIFSHIRVLFVQKQSLVLENFANSQENTCAWWASGLQLYWKRDSSRGVFLWILQNFQEHLFLKNTSGGCFCLSIFKRDRGDLPPHPPPTLPNCVPKLIYFLKRDWYNTNFFFMTMSKFSKTSLLTLKSPASHG